MKSRVKKCLRSKRLRKTLRKGGTWFKSSRQSNVPKVSDFDYGLTGTENEKNKDKKAYEEAIERATDKMDDEKPRTMFQRTRKFLFGSPTTKKKRNKSWFQRFFGKNSAQVSKTNEHKSEQKSSSTTETPSSIHSGKSRKSPQKNEQVRTLKKDYKEKLDEDSIKVKNNSTRSQQHERLPTISEPMTLKISEILKLDRSKQQQLIKDIIKELTEKGVTSKQHIFKNVAYGYLNQNQFSYYLTDLYLLYQIAVNEVANIANLYDGAENLLEKEQMFFVQKVKIPNVESKYEYEKHKTPSGKIMRFNTEVDNTENGEVQYNYKVDKTLTGQKKPDIDEEPQIIDKETLDQYDKDKLISLDGDILV